jgi:hypothetical protein
MKKNKIKKNVFKAVVLTTLLITTIVIIQTPTGAVRPNYPASRYIKEVYPWMIKDTDPPIYTGDGVGLLLTSLGDTVGKYWRGASTLAYFTIDEYEKITGFNWPYNMRSKDSIAFEIQFHCLFTDASKDTIDMGFSEWWWD